MRGQVEINDRGYMGGMDTLHEPGSVHLEGKCQLLDNLFPGDPPIPRNALRDLMADTTKLGQGSIATLFKPPIVAVRSPDGNICIFVMHDAGSNIYGVEVWDIGLGVRYKALDCLYADTTYFGMLPLHGAVYLVSDQTISTNYDDSNKTAILKIFEYNSTTQRYEDREGYISQTPTVSAPAVANNSTGLTAGYWVDYAWTYVRRSNSKGDNPSEYTTYSPGVLEGLEDLDGRQAVELPDDTTATKSFGDATSVYDVTDRGNDIFRYEWDGTGTDPNFETNSMAVDDRIVITGTGFDGRNTGSFRVTAVDDDYFEVENKYGFGETSIVCGTADGIAKKYCKVTITLPGSAERTLAQAQGATHLRIYRTDHDITKETAEGLTHRFLVDVPIYGTNYAATYVDTTTQAALEGEDNFLGMTDYTVPSVGRFIEYSDSRVWVGGNPNYPGRVEYSEQPGEDGAGSEAEQEPMKYASMFRNDTYWVECDPDDGQDDTGIKVYGKDLYIFKEKKIFRLINSDPSYKPEDVSREIGCAYPNTIKVKTLPGIGEILFFMSNEGPAMIRPGGTLELVPDFAIEELWPDGDLLTQSDGTLLNQYTRERVYAVVHQNTVFVLYGDSEDDNSDNLLTTNKIYGYHRSPDNKFVGCLKITFDDFTLS
ncbi:hypothetical protein GF352_05130 [archaeon]|nr:hypothetical protein [archaeon]